MTNPHILVFSIGLLSFSLITIVLTFLIGLRLGQKDGEKTHEQF